MATHVPRRSKGFEGCVYVASVRSGGLDDVAAKLPQDVFANRAGHTDHRSTDLTEVLVVCGHRAPRGRAPRPGSSRPTRPTPPGARSGRGPSAGSTSEASRSSAPAIGSGRTPAARDVATRDTGFPP